MFSTEIERSTSVDNDKTGCAEVVNNTECYCPFNRKIETMTMLGVMHNGKLTNRISEIV